MKFKDNAKNTALVVITGLALLLDVIIMTNLLWRPNFEIDLGLTILLVMSKIWTVAFIFININCRINDNVYYDEDEDYVNHKINIYTIEK